MDEDDLPGGNDENPIVNDVDAVFNRIPNDSTIYKFSKGEVSKPKGGHLQGMQASRDGSVYVLSGSSDETAYLLTVDKANLTAIDIKDITPKDSPRFSRLKHARGFQVIGNFLVVGLENNREEGSIVSLYEVKSSSLEFKRNLVEREGMTEGTAAAGAVGIVKLESGEFLMVVGTWDCYTVDIYKSNKEPLGEPACTFDLIATWKKNDAVRTGWIDNNWAPYQSLNLVLSSDGNVYMFAFNRSSNGNFVDLFSVNKEVDANTVNGCFLKRTNKAVTCHDGVSFRLGAGIWIRDEGNISLLASERNLDERTTINLF